MGLPVVTVASGGLAVVDVSSTAPQRGLPVAEAPNGYGLRVTKVAVGQPGLPVVYIAGGGPDILDPDLVAWYTAHDSSFMTVNTDGSGGAPADGGRVGRWLDRSDNNNHLSATSAGTRALWRAGSGLNFIYDSGMQQSSVRNIAVTPMPRLDSSGAMIVWLSGSGQVPLVDLGTSTSGGYATMVGGASGDSASDASIHTGLAIQDSAIYLTGRRCVIGWRSNASNFVWYVNGAELSRAALAAGGDMTSVFIGTFSGGSPMPIRVFEAVFYQRDIGAAKMANITAYLRSRAGALGDTSKTVFALGDSLTMGVGSDTNRPWHDRISNRSNSVWYAFAGGGFLAEANLTYNTINTLKGSAESVVVVWLGTNDILTNSRTGAQLHGYISLICTPLKAAGNKVIVCTLQHFATNNVLRQDFNTLLKANYATYADAIVKLDEHAALSNAADTTYYCADGVHLKDAAYAVVASLIEAVMATVGIPDTTAPTITSGSTANNTENTVLAHALTADESVTWSIVGGADAARFEVFGSTLRWLGNGAKDFEAPDDADANGIYLVTVRATDLASLTADQTITVTVVDVAVEGGAGVLDRAGAAILDRAGAAINPR